MSRDAKLHLGLLTLASIVLAWSGINQKDRLTWLLGASPAILTSG